MAPHSIPFAKAHGLGNDFLLVEQASMSGRAPGELAVRMCDRHTGAGADGLVVLGPSSAADASFRIYNADGSEAGLSGNAVRCAAAWLLSRSERRAARIALETRVGRRELFFLGQQGSEWILRTEIGRPSFAAADVPFRPPRPVREPITNYPLPMGDTIVNATILSMGNPQCILLVDDFEAQDWMALGAELERHPYFPDRANIGFVRVVSEGQIEARFWERGAGHTLASGTGSCACVVAAHLAGKTGRRVRVALERGELEVNWREDGMVELTGPAVVTVEGTFFL
ncbi:MAG: diaminopimelate epimerase [Acidobacteria bacterium]|nr:diaminopimelate epimerase [Acidobacteriota bacterium]